MQPGAWPANGVPSSGTWGGPQNQRNDKDPERIVSAHAKGGFNIAWGELFQCSRESGISDRTMSLIRCPCGTD